MRKECSILSRAAISFTIGLAGLTYLYNTPAPTPTYNPKILKTPSYTLIDADRDGDVDAIDRISGKDLVDFEMKEYIRNGDRFFDIMGYSIPLTTELQNSATGTLNGNQEPSILERELKEIR